MTISQFSYIADHLSINDCRRLVASLYFTDYELPKILPEAVSKIPRDVPCIHLLLNWNSGKEKWEGKGKSHVVVARRLRQLEKGKIAEWLGKTVFRKLSLDINNTLLQYPFRERTVPSAIEKFKDKSKVLKEDWTIYDSVLWTIVSGVSLAVIYGFYQLITCTCNCKTEREDKQRELQDLFAAREHTDNEDSSSETDVKSYDSDG